MRTDRFASSGGFCPPPPEADPLDADPLPPEPDPPRMLVMWPVMHAGKRTWPPEHNNRQV